MKIAFNLCRVLFVIAFLGNVCRLKVSEQKYERRGQKVNFLRIRPMKAARIEVPNGASPDSYEIVYIRGHGKSCAERTRSLTTRDVAMHPGHRDIGWHKSNINVGIRHKLLRCGEDVLSLMSAVDDRNGFPGDEVLGSARATMVTA